LSLGVCMKSKSNCGDFFEKATAAMTDLFTPACIQSETSGVREELLALASPKFIHWLQAACESGPRPNQLKCS
jgi:hypothetical protein